ncbi:MAG TPA: hypothetical protein VFY79_14785 [Dehalococcoidia bacterium]|nr:hypothetical protein [Dehalococcoidia bacterium]
MATSRTRRYAGARTFSREPLVLQSNAPNRGCVTYDLLGLGLPVALFVAAVLGYIVFELLRGDVHSAVFDGGDVAFYGTLSLFFFYVPYATGYVAFRIAALAGTTRASFLVALGTLAAAILVGIAFTAAQHIPAAVVLGAVLGIPALAGVIACLAQMAAARPSGPVPIIPE